MIWTQTVRSAIVWVLSLLAAGGAIYAVFLAFGIVASHSYTWRGVLSVVSLAIGAGIVWTEVRKEIHHSN